MDNELAIEVKGLTKHYGQILAVDHINFEVKKGELFGFLGPKRGRQDYHHPHITRPTAGRFGQIGHSRGKY